MRAGLRVRSRMAGLDHLAVAVDLPGDMIKVEGREKKFSVRKGQLSHARVGAARREIGQPAFDAAEKNRVAKALVSNELYYSTTDQYADEAARQENDRVNIWRSL